MVQGGTLAGDRKINVGAGTVELHLNDDHEYATFEVNVGMGEFLDKRRDGHDGHLIVSRSMRGSGKGTLQANVGAGKVEVEPVQ